MERLRILKTYLPSLPRMSSNSAPKLIKPFRSENMNGMKRSDRSANPFLDGPSMEEPSLPRVHLILHIVAVFFSFLAICTMGAVAAFQAKWFAVSGGTGFVLFLLVLALILSLILIIVPIIYDRFDRLKRAAQFLSQTRSTFILHAFGTGLMLLSAFIVTISVFTEKGCKKAEMDPHAELGDVYQTDLGQWCTTKKASAVFDWLSFGAWAALLVLTILIFRRERRRERREPSFIPPPSPRMAPTSYSAIYAPQSTTHRDNVYADTGEPFEPPATVYAYNEGRLQDELYGDYEADIPVNAANSMVRGDEPSRTMQLAYNDPYAQIRASLMHDPNAGYASSQAGLYANGGSGGLPQPPLHGMYR